MGISTTQSYRGAQIFEAIGLAQDVIDKYFTWTPSRVAGVGLDAIARETAERHNYAFKVATNLDGDLDVGGQYQWRRARRVPHVQPEHDRAGCSIRCAREITGCSRNTPRRLTSRAARSPRFARCSSSIPAGQPVPLEEVEPATEIVKRFKTGAMSFGSISKEAHENLAIAMNRIGGKSNTGEGGEDPARFVRDANGDLRRSAIKQVASARFGVTSHYLVNADELQIKMAQGAKPGEGGQLPGHKVDDFIAKIRYSTPGRRIDFSAAASRHLFDRRSRAADPRSQEFEQSRAHQRQTGRRGRRRHHRRRRRKGQGRRRADQRLRRRHRRVAAAIDQARGNSVGAGTRRDAADPGDERSARTHSRRDRRPAQDRPRRRHRRAARRRGIRFRQRRAGRLGMHHDARLPSQHLPGRHRDAGSGAPREVRGQARARRELHDVHRGRTARIHGAVGLPHRRRNGWPRRMPRRQRSDRALEGAQRRSRRIFFVVPMSARTSRCIVSSCRITASTRRSTIRSSSLQRTRSSIASRSKSIFRSAT